MFDQYIGKHDVIIFFLITNLLHTRQLIKSDNLLVCLSDVQLFTTKKEFLLLTIIFLSGDVLI